MNINMTMNGKDRQNMRTEIIIIVIILFCPKNIKYAARV